MPALFLQQWLRPLFIACITLVLVACASLPRGGVAPVKSANDDYQYRLLTLDNNMPVLLVSAPESPKAAAALDVLVGSGDNPPGRGGLAHFLEHMLFLGTDKYPDASEYERYITEHGGNRNATTGFENTNYFFDVNAPYLSEALDRFAQFFIAPRFDAEYVDREKNAVEAEYQMGLKGDSRRGLDVLQEVMNPDHPFSQFSVGSLETLADRPGATTRQELISFYEQYYSANNMRLVVLGPQSLDELEALVVPLFSAVPDRATQQVQIEPPLFPPGSLPMVVQVQPQATLRQLDLLFPVADYRAAYDASPLSYVSNLVGHEGKGSLLSQLKSEGLAEGLSAGSGLGWRGGALFSISITLTQQGVQEYQQVLQQVFAYLEMLRAQGPRQWLYEEQGQLAELGFRFREPSAPMNYVRSLARGMHYYAPQDTLRGPYMMTRYDESLLAELMGTLTPDNALVIINDKGVKTDRVSARYQVPYAVQPVSGAQLAAWQGVAGADQFSLPRPNPYIAGDVALVTIDKDNPALPQVVLEEGRQRVWFVQDDEFRVPKGATYINFRSPLVGQSAEQAASAVLYTAVLKDSVNEFTYPALLAGLNFDLYKHAQGMSLRISGYNDKQAILLEQLLAAIANPDFEPQRFENIRKDMIRGLRNRVAGRPSSQVLQDLREALLYGEWGEQALIAVLQQLDLAALQDYASRFWASATAETLVYGNYRRDHVDVVAGLVADIISTRPAPPLPPLKVLKLAAGESDLLAVDVPHDDTVVAWYLQAAADEWRDRAAAELTGQIIKSGFFEQLRTEQQLGYVVSAFAWSQLEVPGLVLMVQSPVAPADAVATAMRDFLASVPAGLDEAQFSRHRKALVADITRPDKNLWERASYYWQSIALKQWDFDGRQALADAVQAFTLQDWLAYYREVFLQQPRSLQVIAPGKAGTLPPGDLRQYDSAEAIKRGHEAYVID